MEINDKGGKLEQRYVNTSWGEVVVGHGQRGSNIEEWRRIKILGQEKHTSRGSKPMNLDWLHLMCIFMCLLALHKFLNLIHACVVYASDRI